MTPIKPAVETEDAREDRLFRLSFRDTVLDTAGEIRFTYDGYENGIFPFRPFSRTIRVQAYNDRVGIDVPVLDIVTQRIANAIVMRENRPKPRG